jgi:antitoxin component of MazEF toxin-antitoxin module
MIKSLTRTGNSVALVLDKQLLEAAHLDPNDEVEVSTNGRIIVIAPVQKKREKEKFERGQELMHAKFAGAFRRLAK